MSTIRQWLESHSMGQYAEAFEANDIDVDLLPELTDETLRQLGVASFGHRLRLLAAVKGANMSSISAIAAEGALSQPARQTIARASVGERRQATVLFSDLSGYTAMNERLDPEEVRGIVGRIKAEAVRIIEGHGGIVNQFVGDEVMALFGVPQAHEDDPVRAVRAARDLHAMVRALAPGVESRIGASLRLHSGISAGLIVTSTEDGRDGTFGVTGDAVNTGARLAAHAEADTVLVSEEIQRIIADYFQTQPLAPVELKGKAGRVTPYRVGGQTGIASRFEAAAQRGFTAYAGRETELALLNAALVTARRGQGRFVTVMGEPGIGKSRLLFEFRHGVPRQEVSVLTAYCQGYGQDTPYLPMVEALRRGLRLEETKSAEALHDRAVAAVRALSPALERYLPQYLHLLSIPSEAHTIPATLQGDALRRAFEEALAAVITESARRQPLVLIYEDWHWADEASDSALKHLCGLIPHYAILVVVTYRPEYERKWTHPQNYHPLVLQPLTERDTAAMLRAVWKATSVPDGLAAQIHARTGGNALFNEEVARGLFEDGKVTVTSGRATLTGALADLLLPDTVHAVIRARVDRLTPETREVLRLASVIGHEFALRLLEKLHAAARHVPAALELLAQQDLIHPLRVVPEPTYLFKHALVQDVVYDTLLLSQRKQLHARAGAAIEALYVDRIEEHYEALADHYSKGDKTDKAVEYLEKAGDKALRLSQAGPALDYFSRAVDLLLATHEPGIETERSRVRIGLKWGRLSWVRPADVLGSLNQIIEIARNLGDQISQAKLIAFAGIAALYTGDPGAQRYFERALESAGADGDLEARGLALQGLGQIKFFTLDVKASLELSKHAALMLSQLGTTTFHRVNAQGIAMMDAAWLGDFQPAKEMWEVIEQTMQGDENDGWWTWWYNYRSGCDFISGNWRAGAHYARLGIERGTVSSNHWGRIYCEFISGTCRFWLDEPAQGLETFERALQQHLEVSGGQVLSFWYGTSAELLAIAGKPREAAERSKHGEKCLGQGDVLGGSFVIRAAALLATANGDYEAADNEFRRGIAFCLQHDIRPQQAVTHFRLAECLQKKGDLPEALKQLGEAEKLFADMEMAWWSEQAEALRARIEDRRPFVWFAPYVDGPPKVAS